MNSYSNKEPSGKKKPSHNDLLKTKESFYQSKTLISNKDEKEIIKEAEFEFQRRQGFKRIFPSVYY